MASDKQRFNAGERVCWESQANGSKTRKEGVIVFVQSVISESWRISSKVAGAAREYSGGRGVREMFDYFWLRAGEPFSYYVLVDPGGKGKMKLYRPRAKQLRAYSEEAPDA